MRRVLRRAGVRWAAGVAVVSGVVGIGACHREGNWPAASLDKHTYISRAWEPKTITLVDTRTDEPVWSVDVPVGKQLVVGFSEGTGPNEYKPDEIVWGLMPAGRQFGERKNRMACPPAYARRLDMTLRPTPEPVWSDDPSSAQYREEPRAIRRVGGRVVEPIDDEPAMPEGEESPEEESAPATMPERAEPAPEPPAQGAPEPEPEPKAEPATEDDPDVEEVPASGGDEPEEPPIDIPE